MKILGVSLVWLLLSGSILVPIGFMSAYANGSGSQSILSTTILSSSTISTILGQSVTFTATVSPSSATGTVQFNDTTTNPPVTLGTGIISGGTATFVTSSLSVGSHNIVAKYLGDTNNAQSTSTPLTQTVNQVTVSTTMISSSHNPSILGQSVTFTVVISPSSATGTVQFNDTTTSPPVTLGTGIISGGTATFVTSSLSVGSHNIVAKYLGDTNNVPSTSTLTQTVNPVSVSTTIISSSHNPSILGQSVTFTATVSPSSATGTVQFNDTTTNPPVTLGTGIISGGAATFVTSSLSVGSHNIVAKYLGDTNNAPSTSGMLETVNQVSTSTTMISSSHNPSILGQSVTFTVVISPSSATGTVQFNDTTTSPPVTLGTGIISGGTATFVTSSLSVGSHNIVAKYLGDTNNVPSTSGIVVETVNQVSTSSTITLSSNATSIIFGKSVTFTATVSPSSATGTVQFNDTTTNPPVTLGTGIISGGAATFVTSSLSVGSHNIVAKYLGTSLVSPSTSGIVIETVNQVSTSTTTSLSSNVASIPFGQSVTFTATVSPSTATGTVQLLVNGTHFGSSVALSGGQATFTTSSLPAGAYTLSASYSGNANLSPSTSNSISITTTINIGAQGSTMNIVCDKDDSHKTNHENSDDENDDEDDKENHHLSINYNLGENNSHGHNKHKTGNHHDD